jgi:hypothetical protein
LVVLQSICVDHGARFAHDRVAFYHRFKVWPAGYAITLEEGWRTLFLLGCDHLIQATTGLEAHNAICLREVCRVPLRTHSQAAAKHAHKNSHLSHGQGIGVPAGGQTAL